MKSIITICKGLTVLMVAIACNKPHEGTLIVDKEPYILSFKVNNTIEGIIDHTKQEVNIYAPWSYDLTAMNTTIEIPSGATIMPTNTTNIDLSKGKTYRVLNGNLYWDYNVKAQYSQMLSFDIGNYKGKIDNSTGEITIKYPMGQSVTDLSPTFVTTPGAVVSPSSGTAHDFTNPVTYTMQYAGEEFKYVVTLVPTQFEALAFLGTAKSSSAIANDDEKKAFLWFSENFDNHTYISFDDIKSGKVKLSDYKTIWWHLDGNTQDLPSEATNQEVINKIKNYYRAGGSLFLSSWAVQYVANLGIAKDGKKVNNMWGEGNAPFAIGDDWGICYKGNESHPIFAGLTKRAGSNDVSFLISKGTKVKAHNALWNFEWGDYANDIPRWSSENGAINLASFHWNDAMNRAAIFEYPSDGTSGKTICVGIEAYDWYNEDNSPENTHFSNIERLTTNIIEYLSK